MTRTVPPLDLSPFPVDTHATLAAWAEQLCLPADGVPLDPTDTLDLGTPAGVAALEAVRAGDPAARGRWTSIWSFAACTRRVDLAETWALLRLALAPGGRVLALEPVGRPGWTGLVVGQVGARQRSARGLELNRDVPAAARAAGFLVADQRRLELDTPVLALRRWVALRTVVVPPSPFDDPAGED